MRLHRKFHLLLLMFFLIRAHLVESAAAKKFDKAVQQLAAVGRLLNGIQLQSKFLSGTADVDQVTSDLLGTPQKVVAELAQLDSAILPKALFDFYDEVKKAVPLGCDLNIVAQGMQHLEDLKKYETSLKSQCVGKKRFEEAFALLNGDQKNISKLFTVDPADITLMTEVFSSIHGKAVDRSKLTTNLQVRIKIFHETFLPPLLHFYRDLNGVSYFAGLPLDLCDTASEAITKYISFLPVLTKLSTNLDSLTKGVKLFLPILRKHSDIQKSIDVISASLNTMSTVTSTTIDPRLTRDLDSLLKDLKGSIFQKLISKGKAVTKLANFLSPLEKIKNAAEEMDSNFTALLAAKTVDAIQNVLEESQKVMTSASNVSRNRDIVGSLQHVIASLVDLKDLQPVDFAAYNQLSKDIRVLKDEARGIRNMSENITEMMNAPNFKGCYDKMIIIMYAVTGAQADDIVTQLSDCSKDLLSFFQTVEYYIKINTGSLKNYRQEIAQLMSFDAMQTVTNAVEQSKILEFVNKLVDTSVPELKNFGDLLQFNTDIQPLKNNNNFPTAIDYLEKLSSVGKNIETVRNVMIAMNNTKPRKRRETNGLGLLGDAKTDVVSVDLNRGLRVLEEFVRILKLEDDVMVAANANGALKARISQIPNMSKKVWRNDVRVLMGYMVEDIKKLDAFAGKLDDTKFTSLGKLFGEAGGVRGPEIDARLFADPIATSLAADSDPKMVSTAAAFDRLGTLDLKFSQHHINVRVAFTTIPQVQSMFDELFGNAKEIETSPMTRVDFDSSEHLTSVLLIGVVAGLVVLALVGVGAYYAWRRLGTYRNGDRVWIYSHYTQQKDPDREITVAARDGKMMLVEDLIRQGCYINVYRDGMTCLHMALQRTILPEIVEMLIKSGADVNMQNVDRQTPEMILKNKMKAKTTKTEELKAMKAVEKIFNKYRGQTFKLILPKPLDPARFNIRFITQLDASNEIADAFQKEWRLRVDKDGNKELLLTHYVVETDAEGVFDIDQLKASPTDLDKIQYLLLVFSAKILVKLSWIEACLKNKLAFHKDYEYRVTKVRYNNKVYDTVDEWKKWMRRYAISCLQNAKIVYATHGDENSVGDQNMKKIVTGLGATLMSLEELTVKTPVKPLYWDTKLAPVLIVYRETSLDEVLRLKEAYGISYSNTEMQIISVTQFFETLLELNGWKNLPVPSPVEHIELSNTESVTAATN